MLDWLSFLLGALANTVVLCGYGVIEERKELTEEYEAKLEQVKNRADLLQKELRERK